jgi:hypothetical protein
LFAASTQRIMQGAETRTEGTVALLSDNSDFTPREWTARYPQSGNA